MKTNTQAAPNQYSMILEIAAHMRQNPKSETVKQLKACKTQAAMMQIFYGTAKQAE